MKKKLMNKTYAGKWILPIICTGLMAITSCGDFLDEKPDQALVVPNSLEELESLLDNGSIMTETPSIQLLATDDVVLSDQNYASLSELERGVYHWAADPLTAENSIACWNKSYQQVFYSNIVLDELSKMDGGTDTKIRNLKGRALFSRAHAFYQLVVVFAPYYAVGENAAEDGIIMPESSNVNERTPVSSLQESFDRIIADLKEAADLLPQSQGINSRPTKYAALALLSRVYLYLGNWEECKKYSEQALGGIDGLLDFNSLEFGTSNPFLPFGQEVVFHSRLVSYRYLSTSSLNPELYGLFEEGDLRKEAYLTQNASGEYMFTGSLTGTRSMFSGISAGEVYLNIIEAKVRMGEYTEALDMLNNFRQHRYQTEDFLMLEDLSENEVREIVLLERRKELMFRGIRFSDLKRLNKVSGEEVTLSREVAGATLVLPPNDPRYVYSFPLDEKSLNPNL